METQDSIDIAKLQRVALGLEHDPSQPFLSGPARIASASAEQPNCCNHHLSARFLGGASPTTIGSSSTSSPNPSSSILKPPSSKPRQHELDAVKSYNPATDQSQTNPALSTPFVKMDSVEAAPGDTQVVSQSVYDSLIRQNEESMYQGISQNMGDGATLRTLHEGDSGHIDLLSQFDNVRHEDNLSQDEDAESNYDENESSPIPYNPDFFPESQRFLATTPGTAMKVNQTPGTSMQTPSISRNPLAGEIESSGGMLALSQLFKATQAPSSPLVHTQQLELISDRPSPNLPIQHRRLTNAVSSPLMERPMHFARESSEPNLHYISLKDSQSRRDKTLGERLTRSANNMETSDDLDHEFYKESSYVENARRQRQIDEEAAAQFAALKAPSRSATGVATSPSQPTDEVRPEETAHEAAGSEEETEQEDNVGPQVPQSQEIMQSSEEDKENYHGPPVPVEAASSAHDRLSQALAMDEHQLMVNQSDEFPAQDLAAVALTNKDLCIGRSSQVMVKDSQQTPRQSPKPDEHSSKPPSQRYDTLVNHMSDVEENSPVRPRLRSSPPESQQKETSWPKDTSNTKMCAEEEVQASSLNETKCVQSSNPSDRDLPGSIPHGTQSGIGTKSSSMPSRVTETPVHLRPQISDMAPMTSIPETSPEQTRPNEWESELNGGGLNNEDDDLPPMFAVQSVNRRSRPGPSQTQSSPIKMIQAQEVQSQILSSPSGRQRRALTAIAASASPQVDHKVDWGLDFFTAEDDEFNALVIDGSPTRPRKRRRGNLGQVLRPSDIVLPSTPHGFPPKTVAPSQLHSSAEKPPPNSQEMLAVQVPVSAIHSQLDFSSRPSSRSASQSFARSTSRPASRSASRPPARSRSRPASRSTSRSASRAASRPAPRALSRPPSRRSENVWEVESPQRDIRRRSRSRPGRLMTSRDPPPQRIPVKFPDEKSPPRPVIAHNPQPVLSSELTEAELPSDISMLSTSNITKSPSNIPQPHRTTPESTTEDSEIRAPNQVIAVWQGSKRAYYPGTCFGAPVGVTQGKYCVKFLDSLPVEVNKGLVKRLELRVGDAVKVEMPGFPKVAQIICGFSDRLTREEIVRASENGLYPQTDVYGYSAVLVASRQRNSLPNGAFNAPETLTKVSISRIYMDTNLWNRFQDRDFTHKPETAPMETTFRASSMRSSLPTSPNFRVPRASYDTAGIFSKMAFAVSYKEDEASKNRITRLIRDNGGMLLNDGFTELFETASVETSKGDATNGVSTFNSLSLDLHAADIGFTCLIADTHSRREKYMQALALNIPCLSGRWIEDCVAKGRILDWDIYLLPAGESTYLNGATRSRIMTPTPPTEARLSETIASRPRLLAGKSVLIVMGRGKAEEKRKAYVFLTLALGASRVDRVPDLETARALLGSRAEASSPPSWDYIYVDDADQTAAKSMLASTQPQTVKFVNGRKRRRSTVTMSRPNLTSLLGPHVVGSEFVCQSLILGRLVEE
ncbi:DNA repair protein crb2 [Penicillium rolfsii]|nr:DNA repair protein crb2 [Penicillium rolfsii]